MHKLTLKHVYTTKYNKKNNGSQLSSGSFCYSIWLLKPSVLDATWFFAKSFHHRRFRRFHQLPQRETNHIGRVHIGHVCADQGFPACPLELEYVRHKASIEQMCDGTNKARCHVVSKEPFCGDEMNWTPEIPSLCQMSVPSPFPKLKCWNTFLNHPFLGASIFTNPFIQCCTMEPQLIEMHCLVVRSFPSCFPSTKVSTEIHWGSCLRHIVVLFFCSTVQHRRTPKDFFWIVPGSIWQSILPQLLESSLRIKIQHLNVFRKNKHVTPLDSFTNLECTNKLISDTFRYILNCLSWWVQERLVTWGPYCCPMDL